jgi:GT2 family glycosyltransferase
MTKPKKVSLIIAVYKNVNALKILLDALRQQTIPADEIIIAEDGEFDEMHNFIVSQNIPNLIHLTQEDTGWRKARSLNNAIKKASGDYLIIIDGDCIPHPRFIEGHIACSEKGKVCCGKRSELGEDITKMIYEGRTPLNHLSKNYLFNVFLHHKAGTRHYEEGIYIPYTSWFYRFLKQRHVRYMIGCNYSCYKADMLAINGLDEEYTKPSVGEDIDLGWRFRGLGIELKSCRNAANVYHLYHKKNFDVTTLKENDAILKKNFDANRFVCINGIENLSEKGVQ